MVPKIQTVKFEKTKKSSISICKRTSFRFFNFDGSYFWNYWEFRDVMYFILKVWSVVKWSQKLKGVTALLPSTTPLWNRPFYTRKGQVAGLFWAALYYDFLYSNPDSETGRCASGDVRLLYRIGLMPLNPNSLGGGDLYIVSCAIVAGNSWKDYSLLISSITGHAINVPMWGHL